jgi:glycosyltransferase involved in cell wall biosynthesis
MRILFAGVEPFIPDSCTASNRTVLDLCQHLALTGHEPVVLSGNMQEKDKQIFRDNSFNFPIYRSGRPLKTIAALLVTILPDVVVLVGRKMASLVEILSEMDFPVTVWLFDNDCHDLRVLFLNPVRRKGVELVFEIASKRPSLRFTFVETECLSDEWRQYCYKKAAQCGNIDWHKPSLEMHGLYSQSRLMLVPSICEEGFCRGVTEAQRFGIPVLASDRGYLPTNVGVGGSIINLHEPLSAWLEEFDRLWESAGSNTDLVSSIREHAFLPEMETEKVAGQFISRLKSHVEKKSSTSHQNLRVQE